MDGDPSYCILLIGAGGQLGRELIRSLAPLGTVVACVRTRRVQPLFSNARVADLLDLEQTRSLVRDVRPNLIVNAAAYTAVDAAERDAATARAVNEIGPRVLAEEAARVGAALVHYSTDYVFSGAGSAPWAEQDHPAPLNAYGETKLAGEMAIRATGVSHLIVRTSWLYGVDGVNFVKRMLHLAATRPELAVVNDQFGSPTSARFVAGITARMVARSKSQPEWFRQWEGLLHATCGGETTWFEFATEIFRAVQRLRLPINNPVIRPISSAAFTSAAQRPRNCRLSTLRLRQSFELPDWSSELERNLPNIYQRLTTELKEIGQTRHPSHERNTLNAV